MNIRTYIATVRKVHTAYTALKAASDTAEYGEAVALGRVMDRLRDAPDEMRVQVCQKCNRRGWYSDPDDPYTGWSCLHEDVPRYDVRTGEPIA